MAASSEESRYAQSVMSFMDLCTDIHPSLRKHIANSKAYRTFVLDLAQEGSTENVAMYKAAHKKCAAAWKEVLGEKLEEKKRKAKELEEVVQLSKRTKPSHALDTNIRPRPRLKAKAQSISRTSSPSVNEDSISHAAEKNIPPSPTNSDNSLFVAREMTPAIQTAISRAVTPEDEAHMMTSDTETSCSSSGSRDNDSIVQDIQPATVIREEDASTSPHTSMIQTVAHMIQSLKGARGIDNTSSTSMVSSIPADSNTTLETAESMSQAASPSSAANRQLLIADGSLMPDSELKSTKELGITLGSPAIIGPIKDHCLSWSEWAGHQHRESNIDDILNVCTRFNFDIAKYKLLQYLKGRPALTGIETPATPIPSTWDMYETADIVNALQIIGSSDKHGKIHRAYAQMKLFHMVEAKPAGAVVVRNAGKHVSEHLIYLESLAKRKAATVAMQDTMEKRYTAAYFAGKKWSEVASWFGGVGSVLVFVTLGIGNSYVEHSWNDFQRACFEHIAKDLPSIKKLVYAMGDGVLEQYCRFDNLTDDLTDQIKGVEGYC